MLVKTLEPPTVSNNWYSFVRIPEDVESGLLCDGTRGMAPVVDGTDLTAVLALVTILVGVDPADADLNPVLSFGPEPGADLGRFLLGTQVLNAWEALVRLFWVAHLAALHPCMATGLMHQIVIYANKQAAALHV